MNNEVIDDRTLTMDECKRIRVILPDDGTDLRLMKALRLEENLTRVDTVPVRAIAVLEEAEARPGRLPESTFAKMVTVIVNASAADALFDRIYEVAEIHRPGGGAIFMQRSLGATPYVLPSGVPDEGG